MSKHYTNMADDILSAFYDIHPDDSVATMIHLHPSVWHELYKSGDVVALPSGDERLRGISCTVNTALCADWKLARDKSEWIK